MTKVFMRSIERAAIIVNITHLLLNCWKPHKYIDLYHSVNDLFVLPDLNNNGRYKSIFGKTYQKNPVKIKGVLVE